MFSITREEISSEYYGVAIISSFVSELVNIFYNIPTTIPYLKVYSKLIKHYSKYIIILINNITKSALKHTLHYCRFKMLQVIMIIINDK